MNFTQDKIFGDPDPSGRSIATKLWVWRGDIGKDGKPRKYPWMVHAETGTGIKVKNANGGTYMQKGSYVQTAEVTVNLSDQDMFRLFHRACRYIEVWELTNGPKLLREAEQLRTAQAKEKENPQAA